MNATLGDAPVSRGAAVRRRPGATLRTLAVVSAAILAAAAGFVGARSLGRVPIPPAAVCSETCAPSRTVDRPPTRRIGVATPTSSNHGRSLR
jgi:hypothetical protein